MKTRVSRTRNMRSGAGMIGALDNVVLCESPVFEPCGGELKEMQKHELICKISQLMGPSPSNIGMAEKIFESIKFDLAKYIIHHEYNSPRGISADLLLWLDSKVDPGKAKSVREFFCKYVRQR